MKKLLLAAVLFVIWPSIVYAQCYGPECYRYTPPSGPDYTYRPLFGRGPYNFYGPNYHGYWPRVGYFGQYNGGYRSYNPWSRPTQRYMRCSQTDRYYNNCR